ncbi:hypothetical protein F4678DRAFT_455385 [Xylaria arbuscula]|nr:hypothetical protein F4678DRAFT_455385 [Xylaria arbuscula]
MQFGVVGFVSSILQLISSAHSALSLAKQAHSSTSGLAPAIEQLRLLVDDLRATVADILNSSTNASGVSNRLLRIGEECIELSNNLLKRFDGLQAKQKGWKRKAESLKNAAIYIKHASFLEQHFERLSVKIDWVAEFQEPKRKLAELFKQVSSLSSAVEAHGAAIELHDKNLRGAILHDLIQELDEFRSLLHLAEKRDTFIASLLFDTIKTRFNRIEHSYPETLDWLFATSQTNFRKWLETGDGIYWDTLLLTVQNQATKDALSCWVAPDEKLVSASYFFDYSGTLLQKSLMGLLRTILFEIFRDDPSLVDIIYHDRWRYASWDMEEITQVFDLLVTHQGLETKFCFFVDGLDEYDGDTDNAVKTLQSLAAPPLVKICVSSRPWSCFLRAWGGSELRMELQDLTRRDIDRYVSEKLTAGVKSRKGKVLHHQLQLDQANWLVRNVCQRSKGVWLWVYLVVHVLLGDIEDCEPFEQLRNRLEAIPTDLFQFFENIFQHLDPYYESQRAQIMLLAIHAYRPLPVLILGSIPIDKSTSDPYQQITQIFGEQNEESQAEIWRRRLHNRCGDLMTITRDFKVDFIHRSVREYLTENYLDILHRAVPNNFDADLFLCHFLIAYIENKYGSVDDLLYYASKIDARREDVASNEILWGLLKRLEAVQDSWQRKYQDDFELDDYSSPFLSLLIGHGLTCQTLLTLDRTPELLKRSSFPHLAYPLGLSLLIPRPLSTVNPDYKNTTSNFVVPNLELVEVLLASGADPNQPLLPEMGGCSTIWVYFLLFCCVSWPALKSQASAVDRIIQVIQCFVKHGADVSSQLKIEETTWNWITNKAMLPEMNALDMLAMFLDPETMRRIQLQVWEISKNKQQGPALSWLERLWILEGLLVILIGYVIPVEDEVQYTIDTAFRYSVTSISSRSTVVLNPETALYNHLASKAEIPITNSCFHLSSSGE